MKKVLIASLIVVVGSAYAGHPRCAGSYEPAKCEALEAKLAAETPEQRKARAVSLESNRQASMKEVVTNPATARGSATASGSSKQSFASKSDCMDRYRWDTTAVNTSRLVVSMHFNKQGKGELAKYVSDREAVELVYCSN